MQSKQGVLQEFKGAWKKHHFISSFHSLRVLQKYLTLNSCSLSVVDGVVTVTPDTFECTNAANLTMRGCSNLLPDSATSNVQGATASGNRKKQEAGGGPPSGPTGAGGLGTTPALVDVENLFLSFYMSMDARDRMSIGHQFKDTIKSCSFRGKDCASSEYVHFTIDLMLFVTFTGTFWALQVHLMGTVSRSTASLQRVNTEDTGWQHCPEQVLVSTW